MIQKGKITAHNNQIKYKKRAFFKVFFKGRNMHFNFSSVVVLDEMHEKMFLIEETVFLNDLSVKKVVVLINENTGLYN